MRFKDIPQTLITSLYYYSIWEIAIERINKEFEHNLDHQRKSLNGNPSLTYCSVTASDTVFIIAIISSLGGVYYDFLPRFTASFTSQLKIFKITLILSFEV